MVGCQHADESFLGRTGTGSEDYFCGAWDFGGRDGAIPFAHLYNGAQFIQSAERTGGRYCLYRWHTESPITFDKSIKVTIEHGHGNHRSDNFSSVAYWYQAEPHQPFPPLAPVDDRIPTLHIVGGPGNTNPSGQPTTPNR